MDGHVDKKVSLLGAAHEQTQSEEREVQVCPPFPPISTAHTWYLFEKICYMEEPIGVSTIRDDLIHLWSNGQRGQSCRLVQDP